MAEKHDDRWSDRDFPVLIAAARLVEDGRRGITSQQLARETGIAHREVIQALAGLRDVYLTASDASSYDGADYMVTGLTERGRRTTGIWPSGEGIDAFIDALRQAGDTVEDQEERTFLRRAAGLLASVSKDVLTDVVSAAARVQMGI
ncbi:hypothetical protein [Georgenia yuyongxinii]|uniref:Uncharacterized protein n=1 Tax=Georgenia yuyongxinii TaxID=2589797 RepID=A0A552WVP8_9MICO|nr:hypothetical protein [Georgenia yuyongxinii]TRW46373.1 hypothetical protein FJ693_05455 [Georgenia yuyongxinii]